MAARWPAVVANPQKLLLHTITMTPEQLGAYVRLLASALKGFPGHQPGELPSDEQHVAITAGLTLERWRVVSDAVLPFLWKDLAAASPERREGPRKERDELLASLEEKCPGFGEGWRSWRAALSSAKRGTAWADVLKLRNFVEIAETHSRGDVLDMMKLAAERGWQGFKVEWWESDKKRGGRGVEAGGSGRYRTL